MKKNGLHINESGDKSWYKDGEIHREDGPAIIWYDGDQWWFKAGKLHRDHGPAVIGRNNMNAWYKEGEKYEPTAHELMVWKIEEKEQTKTKHVNKHRTRKSQENVLLPGQIQKETSCPGLQSRK